MGLISGPDVRRPGRERLKSSIREAPEHQTAGSSAEMKVLLRPPDALSACSPPAVAFLRESHASHRHPA